RAAAGQSAPECLTDRFFGAPETGGPLRAGILFERVQPTVLPLRQRSAAHDLADSSHLFEVDADPGAGLSVDRDGERFATRMGDGHVRRTIARVHPWTTYQGAPLRIGVNLNVAKTQQAPLRLQQQADGLFCVDSAGQTLAATRDGCRGDALPFTVLF